MNFLKLKNVQRSTSVIFKKKSILKEKIVENSKILA